MGVWTRRAARARASAAPRASWRPAHRPRPASHECAARRRCRASRGGSPRCVRTAGRRGVPNCRAAATRSNRYWKLPAPGTWSPPGVRPGSPSRARRSPWHRVGLRANQAAAPFFEISRSSRNCRFSRRRRRSSSRSAVVRPSERRPSSRSACRTQLRIASAEASNSRDRIQRVSVRATRKPVSWSR